MKKHVYAATYNVKKNGSVYGRKVYVEAATGRAAKARFKEITGGQCFYDREHAVNADGIIITNQHALITDCYEEVPAMIDPVKITHVTDTGYFMSGDYYSHDDESLYEILLKTKEALMAYELVYHHVFDEVCNMHDMVLLKISQGNCTDANIAVVEGAEKIRADLFETIHHLQNILKQAEAAAMYR